MRHTNEVDEQTRIMEILREAKKLAQEYRTATGKPLGITGEVAEYEAARLLGLNLTQARQAGYDAVEHTAGISRRLQIKGRCLGGYLAASQVSASAPSMSRKIGTRC